MLHKTARLNQIFTNNQEVLKQSWTLRNQKRDIVIEMSGRYGFRVPCELIEMIEAESKVIVD